MKTIKLALVLILITTTAVIAQDDASNNKDYYLTKTVSGDFEQVTEEIKALLKEQGFGILTEIDMHEKLAEKLEDVNINPYRILGVCSPKYAYQSLQAEENIGVFLPCKFIIKQLDDDKIEVVAINPSVLMQMLGNEKLTAIAEEITIKFKTALENL